MAFGLPSRSASAVVLGLFLSALFLYLAVRNVDYQEFVTAFRQAQSIYVFPFLLLISAFYVLKVFRWRALVGGVVKASLAAFFYPMMTGFAANNVFPFRAGELIRVYIAGNTLALPKAKILGTVVIERLFDLLAVGVIVGAALLSLAFIGDAGAGSRLLALSTGIAMATALVLLLFMPSMLSKMRGLLNLLPGRFVQPLDRQIENFGDGLALAKDQGLLIKIGVNSIAQWLGLALCIAVSLFALGIDHLVSGGSAVMLLLIACITLGVMVLGISIPSTAAFIGTIEYAFVLCLGFFDVPASNALAAGVFYHVLSFAFTTLAGAICYLLYRLQRY